MEIHTTSEMTYFTMTKCNKLFITYLTRSTECYTNSSIQYFNHFNNGKHVRYVIKIVYNISAVLGIHWLLHSSSLIHNSSQLYYWASEASPTLGCSIEISRDIRECGSTLYVGLARTAPPTNTNFRLTFLLTRLQKALYEDLAV